MPASHFPPRPWHLARPRRVSRLFQNERILQIINRPLVIPKTEMESGKISHMLHVCMVYLPILYLHNWVILFGQMLGFIFSAPWSSGGVLPLLRPLGDARGLQQLTEDGRDVALFSACGKGEVLISSFFRGKYSPDAPWCWNIYQHLPSGELT